MKKLNQTQKKIILFKQLNLNLTSKEKINLIAQFLKMINLIAKNQNNNINIKIKDYNKSYKIK